ncbi:hypothetical protein [Spiroplasma platyhelix]|uniref:Uncharacterized protein n=1 Tax=Spiroplasma platyhelix PALS-1 TaxID=1276218 RepID=A0A846U4Z3_9MOLU|nr:hypothetical protein [Spiroplasma platyhelix]MBE4704156.1 hypothetical protein [Spiroplasma platyhelix PALS-1]NKE38527.1 hypothetical protein [Spiroplasma platyhelix PALS-1]UJB29414.1 hypothetical protein SPLAT_v1c06500 [Spiroplasma platyhelix PALS-1]
MIDKQGINDNTTNSNNTDIGNNKNNRSTEKNIDKNNSITITDNKGDVKIDQSKKSFGRKILENIQDNFLLYALLIYAIWMLTTILMSITKVMPWWGTLIMILLPFTYWFIIELIKAIKS